MAEQNIDDGKSTGNGAEGANGNVPQTPAGTSPDLAGAQIGGASAPESTEKETQAPSHGEPAAATHSTSAPIDLDLSGLDGAPPADETSPTPQSEPASVTEELEETEATPEASAPETGTPVEDTEDPTVAQGTTPLTADTTISSPDLSGDFSQQSFGSSIVGLDVGASAGQNGAGPELVDPTPPPTDGTTPAADPVPAAATDPTPTPAPIELDLSGLDGDPPAEGPPPTPPSDAAPVEPEATPGPAARETGTPAGGGGIPPVDLPPEPPGGEPIEVRRGGMRRGRLLAAAAAAVALGGIGLYTALNRDKGEETKDPSPAREVAGDSPKSPGSAGPSGRDPTPGRAGAPAATSEPTVEVAKRAVSDWEKLSDPHTRELNTVDIYSSFERAVERYRSMAPEAQAAVAKDIANLAVDVARVAKWQIENAPIDCDYRGLPPSLANKQIWKSSLAELKYADAIANAYNPETGKLKDIPASKADALESTIAQVMASPVKMEQGDPDIQKYLGAHLAYGAQVLPIDPQTALVIIQAVHEIHQCGGRVSMTESSGAVTTVRLKDSYNALEAAAWGAQAKR